MDVLYACSLQLECENNFLELLKYTEKEKKPKRRKYWARSCHLNRTPKSMHTLFEKLLADDTAEFSNFCRMCPQDFDNLLQKVSKMIEKKDTKWRKAIPAKLRLAITLRFLATGESFKSLHFLFDVSDSAISIMVYEVCKAINTALKDEIKVPHSPEEWLEIEEGFRDKFPHCIGALDGKRIVHENPLGSGSTYYNNKNSSSIVLLALVDSDYNFVFVDIDDSGRISDGGVLQNSLLGKKLMTGELNLPPDSPLPGREKNVPYVFLGDEAFALDTHLMKPYPGNFQRGTKERTLNHKLSSTRVIVENVFGVISSVFRVFRKPMALQPKKAMTITKTAMLLHNFLRRRESRLYYSPDGTFDTIVNGEIVREGSWRSNTSEGSALRDLLPIPEQSRVSSLEVRDEFAEFFQNYR